MLTPITIEWNSISPDNFSPVTGGFSFQLVDSLGNVCGLVDSGTGETVTPTAVQAVVDDGVLLSSLNGYPPLVLIANDDATTRPVGTTYLVTEQLSAGNLDPWNLTVHAASPGGVLLLSSQRPTPT